MKNFYNLGTLGSRKTKGGFMRKTYTMFFIGFIFLFINTAVLAEVVVIETQTFKTIDKMVLQKNAQYNQDTLIVLDIDNTLLTTTTDLGGDLWYQWQRGKLAVKPTEEQKVSCLFEDSISLLYELVPMKLMDKSLPRFIKKWQIEAVLIALTSRAPINNPATERELNNYGIDFSLSPLKTLASTELPTYREKIDRDMLYMKGIMLTSGMNKGLMLTYLLEKTKQHFKSIIFVDDSKTNVINMQNEFNKHPDVDMTIFHYTKFEQDRIKKAGMILTQKQADVMVASWDKLNAVLKELIPARNVKGCLRR